MTVAGAVPKNEESSLPSGWAYLPLSDVVDINPKLDKKQFSDDLAVSFVPMPAVEAESGGIDVTAIRKFGEVKKGYTAFQEGDVLFAKITPCMENGKMAVVPVLHHDLGFGSTEFHVLRSSDKVLPKYIYYFVSSKQFRVDAEHNMTGAVGQRRVPTSYLQNIKIPLPPLGQQKDIVAKIEELFSELDNGIAALKIAREQLKVYRQAVLKHAFEGKLTTQWREENKAAEWEVKPLGDLLSFITSGSRGWAKYYSDRGDIFIRAQNIKNDRLELDDVAYVTLPDKSEGTRTQVQEGDVLITITGANVTKTGYVERDIGRAYVSQHVALCRPKSEVITRFLYWNLIAETVGRKQLKKLAYGAGKPGLNLDNIRSVEISLPSRAEQEVIVEKIQNTFSYEQSLEDILENELQKSETVRQSILKKAFSGKLVPEEKNADRSNVLPFPNILPGISERDLHAGIISLAYQLHEEKPQYLETFGYVKAEKINHMVEYHLGISLGRIPVKDVAGPNDYPNLRKTSHRADKANWFRVSKTGRGNYVFLPKPGFAQLQDRTRKILGDKLSDVENLLQQMLPMTSRQAEVLATVYAAWNNLLLMGVTPDDERIVTEARESWHESKLGIERSRFFKAIQWMRKNALTPSGRGSLVTEKHEKL